MSRATTLLLDGRRLMKVEARVHLFWSLRFAFAVGNRQPNPVVERIEHYAIETSTRSSFTRKPDTSRAPDTRTARPPHHHHTHNGLPTVENMTNMWDVTNTRTTRAATQAETHVASWEPRWHT